MIYKICGVVILIAAILRVYDRYVGVFMRGSVYEVSFIDKLNFFFVVPAFWLCLGVLAAAVLIGGRFKGKLRKVLVITGAAIFGVYLVLVLVNFLGEGLKIVSRLMMNAEIFLIPGLLIGVGLEEKAE